MAIKKRHYLILAGICILGIFFGSLFDLQINQSIFSERNGFAIFISSIGCWPTYAGVPFCGAGIFLYALKTKMKKYQQVLLFVFAFIATFSTSIFVYKEFVGVNGFNLSGSMKLLGIIPVSIMSLGGFALGFFFFRNKVDESLLIKLVVLVVALGLAAGIVEITKIILPRPRYRALQSNEFKNAGIYFSAWWNKFTITEKIKSYSFYSKEEFKSFPSGHTNAATSLIFLGAYLPLFDKSEKTKKLSIPLFYIGFAYGCFVAYCRMMVGAHFLSDVSFGALICVTIQFLSQFVLSKIEKKKATRTLEVA